MAGKNLRFARGLLLCFSLAYLAGIGIPRLQAQGGVPTFAGNAQHSAIFQPSAQNLGAVHWSTSVDLNNTSYAHYGSPLVTPGNTVLVPVKTASNGFQVTAFNAANGTVKYTLATDYILPAYTWIPTYDPALASYTDNQGVAHLRLYYAGVGGTIYYIENPDSNTPGAPVQEAFYGLGSYQASAAGFNSIIFINTPITVDTNGNIFFGFRVQGTAPAPLNTPQSGFARVDSNGNGTYVLAGTAANDGNIGRDSHNSAPALSQDQSTLYVAVKSSSTEYYGYLLGLNSTTLATKYSVFLTDPRNGNPGGILDISTASPAVGPDGDVYFGIRGNPDNGYRGFMLHFSGDLTVEKIPGGFGWDYTVATVPASMVPSYTGPSSYLIFSKYNNYAGTSDGDGVNKIALLDPNVTQVDPHSSANGLLEMREVFTATGPTPDPGYRSPQYPNAVLEWCINTAAVNPANNSVYMPSEDGNLYRWNLITNSLSQSLALGPAVGDPYVPTVLGPDGTIYTMHGGTLFAVGGLSGVSINIASSVPDNRTVVAGQPLSFSVAVANLGSSGITPTGTITFQDLTYQGLTPVTTNLMTVSLDSSGDASYTTAALGSGIHFITATYSGDANFSSGNASLVQEIHASGTTTTLVASPATSTPGQAVNFTATVAPVTSGAGTPTGMVTFEEGTHVLGQDALNGGTASFSTSALSLGSHSITALYYSDSSDAASTSLPASVTVSSSGAQAIFVGSDTTTQGNWHGAYGADGYDLANAGQSLPTYDPTFAVQNESTWTWATSTTDARALQTDTQGNRIAATWYSASSFSFDVNFTDTNTHQISLYLIDWDSQGRKQTVQIIDTNSNTVLDTENVPNSAVSSANFTAGTYLIWNISGHITIKVTSSGAPNAVVSGVFFGGAGGSSAPSAVATFTGFDTSTQGTWVGKYGADGYSLANVAASIPSYASFTVQNQLNYTWASSTADPRALETANASQRVAATWYNGSSFNFDLNFTDGNSHKFALYAVDWDNGGRSETVQIVDANTNAVLNTETISSFAGGTYLVWNISGHVKINVTTIAGFNAVVSGVFFGGGGGSSAPSAVATFTGFDTSTQGTWVGKYGADGYSLANVAASVPSYASFTVQNQLNYTWASGTTDPRALETPDASQRIAAAWYNGSSFNFDLNFTDGNSHKFALYAVDWDNGGRSETVQIVDANTNAVLNTETISSFAGGTYLVWNISGHVKINVTTVAGFNAVVSGVFFGGTGGSSAPSAVATFTSFDTGTQGTWVGKYGTDGYSLANVAASVPSYASFTIQNQLSFTWASNTTDPRALETADASQRIAATWYNGSSFNFDSNFTDGNSHKFALYAVDWDNNGRSETVQIVDATSGTVLDTETLSSFGGGTYLVWNISGHVKINVTAIAGYNAVVSGAFFN